MLPPLFENRIRNQLQEQAPVFFESLLQSPTTALRIHPHKTFAIPSNWQKIPWCKEGYYLPGRPSFTLDPRFHAGAYYVQEPSSMILAAFSFFHEPVKVLDLCAAPGGKSTLLATLLPPGSLLWSNEAIANRASILKENCIRWGYPGHIITQNQPHELNMLQEFFDYILVDAPCSGEGLWRKEPLAVQEWTPYYLEKCVVRQRQILEAAIPLLKVGGTLVYSTCTFNPAENEENIIYLLKKYPSILQLKTIHLASTWGWTENRDHEGKVLGYTAWPHRVKGEGLFFAVLQKISALPYNDSKQQTSTKFKNSQHIFQSISSRHKAILPLSWLELINQKLYQKDNFIFALTPEELKLPKGPHYLKVGICIGQIKGKDFIPSHELALSLMRGKEIPTTSLEYEQAIMYLKKEDIHSLNTTPGFSIATYQDLPLGWIYVSGKRINNKLPSSWRIRQNIPPQQDLQPLKPIS
ncbi:MAG: RsmB/NOP family class I SAM-dependent RNA methyltransferase [Bacteroidia bacterium]|nr:RsmB/NOP family class I SAM-dependent RNA methyltransferase [Bacteroidia bacterium]